MTEIKPLTETVFLLLLSLEGGPKHGYAMIKEVHKLSGERVRLTTGTLYGALKRLLDDEWIAPHEQRDTARDKKAYALTRTGKRRLDDEIARLRQLVAASKRVREA